MFQIIQHLIKKGNFLIIHKIIILVIFYGRYYIPNMQSCVQGMHNRLPSFSNSCSQRNSNPNLSAQLKLNFQNILDELISHSRNHLIKRQTNKRKTGYKKVQQSDCSLTYYQSNIITEHESLVAQCYNSYQNFMNQLLHNKMRGHLDDYNNQLHCNSTNMKQNLINLLKDEQKTVEILKDQLSTSKNKISELLLKNEELIKTINDKQNLSKQNQEEEILILNGCIEELKSSLQDKENETQNIKQKLNQYEKCEKNNGWTNRRSIIKTHSFISGKQNSQPRDHSRNQIIKICNNKKKQVKIQMKDNKDIEEDLMRIMYLQALVIQNQILEHS